MSFRQATLKQKHSPPVRDFPAAAAESWTKGALLLRDALGNWAECGADPALIGAVALSSYAVAPASVFDRTGDLGIPPGHALGMLVSGEQEFSAEVIGDITLAVIGTDYGVAVDADGFWKIDLGDVVATRVKYTRSLSEGIGTPTRLVVKFLAANVQLI